MVWQVARAKVIPIIAVGGIATIDDVMEMLVAGASAVQIGTANFYDPSVSVRIVGALPEALRQIDCASVREAVGAMNG
jgi:dihydroorotate dehydrogenase (NAD+) catalytic subunit